MNFRLPLSLVLAGSLASCGGGDISIGGKLSGLPTGNTIVLQNNGGDDLTLTRDGDFTFSDQLLGGKAYNVTVKTQPAAGQCTVTNGTGTTTTDGPDITTVTVTCVSASLGGTITGLMPGASVTLRNGDTVLAPIGKDGDFTFPTTLAAGTSYNVQVETQPAVGSCTVTNGTGTIVAGTLAKVTVNCT